LLLLRAHVVVVARLIPMTVRIEGRGDLNDRHANSSMIGVAPSPIVIGRPEGEIAGFLMFMPAAKVTLA